jgi:hypothetical protein
MSPSLAGGLPYGSIPRLLLARLTTEAVRNQSRDLVLGDSMSAFMRQIGLMPTGGPRGYIRALKDQAMRLFASTITAFHTYCCKAQGDGVPASRPGDPLVISEAAGAGGTLGIERKAFGIVLR